MLRFMILNVSDLGQILMFLYENDLGFKLGHMNPIIFIIKVLLLFTFSVLQWKTYSNILFCDP